VRDSTSATLMPPTKGERFVIPADAKSWVEVPADHHFPIQNLPLGICCPGDQPECVCVRIGDYALHLWTLCDAGLIPEEDFPPLCSFQDLAIDQVRQLRKLAYDLLREDNPTLRDNESVRSQALIPISQAEMQIPMLIGQFVDFYAGINHASNVGRMFRPDQPPLLPNYRWIPVGYNGRASSVIISGDEVRRPKGIYKPADSDTPVYGPSKELDFELEMGFFVGGHNGNGHTMSPREAENHMMGVVLVNDWSARDIQRFEYQPLGPFLGKSFATSISPWVVTMDALEPFRIAGPTQDPQPLEHLRGDGPQHFDIHLEVLLKTQKMSKPQVISRTNFKELYWSFGQQLAHQTSNGTPIESGDLYASGTISGTEKGTFGSLLELSWKGTEPLTMEETGETRTYLEDGDTLILTGWCQGDGYRVGFGSCEGTVVS
jgi:fumarylacetoacetase